MPCAVVRFTRLPATVGLFGTKKSQSQKQKASREANPLKVLVGRAGIEPATNGLRA
jgi:hypothetical protein